MAYKMKIIGLTGGTGSGKGIVSAKLDELGAYIVDADKIAHEIILKGRPAYEEIVAFFGKDILDEKGEIVRKALGTKVFAEGGEKLEFLNRCTHKYIYDKMKEEIKKAEKNGYKAAILDAPLLLEGRFKSLCDEVWAVYAEKSVRISRITKRDGITKKQAEERIASQADWSIYKKNADVIIDNSGKIEETHRQTEAAYQNSVGESYEA